MNQSTRKPRTKTTMHIHCTQEENIRRLNEIIVGDGHPEDGLAFKVGRMADSVDEIKMKLSAASDIEKEMEIIRRVDAEKEKLKKEFEGKKSLKFGKVTKIVGLVLGGLTIIAMFVLNLIEHRNTSGIPILEKKVDMLNVPVNTSRGLELWPSGMLMDSVNKTRNGKN